VAVLALAECWLNSSGDQASWKPVSPQSASAPSQTAGTVRSRLQGVRAAFASMTFSSELWPAPGWECTPAEESTTRKTASWLVEESASRVAAHTVEEAPSSRRAAWPKVTAEEPAPLGKRPWTENTKKI